MAQTNIAHAEYFDSATFSELRRTFLEPLYHSDFRMVLSRIEIDAGSEEFAQWTADIYLDTGEHIALHSYGSFFQPNSATHFKEALRRVLQQLDASIKMNSKLRSYFRENFPKHRNA